MTKSTNELMEILEIITLYNENLLKKFDGDQGATIGLITFIDEIQGVAVWNPFYDCSLRIEVNPTEEYTEQQLQSMVNQLHPKEVIYTGGQCMADLYKVKVSSEVQSIGVTSDCIVGFAEIEPFDVEIPTEVWIEHL